jgi:hypothetical protein
VPRLAEYDCEGPAGMRVPGLYAHLLDRDQREHDMIDARYTLGDELNPAELERGADLHAHPGRRPNAGPADRVTTWPEHLRGNRPSWMGDDWAGPHPLAGAGEKPPLVRSEVALLRPGAAKPL